MKTLQQELRQFLKKSNFRHGDDTAALHSLDFWVLIQKNKIFKLDVKEKTQSYNANTWGIDVFNEKHTFIIDELAVTKIIWYGPESGVLVRDLAKDKYIFFSAFALSTMQIIKKVNRPIESKYGNVGAVKGKWLIDFRKGIQCDDLKHFMHVVIEYMKSIEFLYLHKVPCQDYSEEIIEIRGSRRTMDYRKYDLARTY